MTTRCLPPTDLQRKLAPMPTGGNEAEWLTRKKRIDTKFGALNPPWQIIPWREGLDTSTLARHAVTEFPTDNQRSVPANYMNTDKLTPSLLARAFRGQLVPQDPTDEPASVLLGRIKSKGNNRAK